MLKLKKIIVDLAPADYSRLEENLLKNKADNLLYLLQNYRQSTIDDAEIIEILKANSNSFYVLKSRLYSKIQEFLLGNVHSNKEEVLRLLHKIPELCSNSSREVAVACLEKLEKDLLSFDMHSELVVVYSALKKMHVYSQKYFHYSQMYNKHVAFSLSLEKSEEILGNFNRILAQYNFSKAIRLQDSLVFIHKEISDHFTLNKSRQIEIIKNIIQIQLALFCHGSVSREINIDDDLNQTRQLIDQLPDSSPSKSYNTLLNFLFFDHYFMSGQTKNARTYYKLVNENFNTLFLQTNSCLTSAFLMSKIAFLQQEDLLAELNNPENSNPLYDFEDVHTMVLLGIYNAMIAYYNNQLKDAALKLNEIINTNSFKDYFHIQLEVKLTLAFIYQKMNEYEMADNLLKNIYRKIKSEKITSYQNVLDLLKVFGEQVKLAGKKISPKQRDHYVLFEARNKGEYAVLKHLVVELRKKYNPS